MKAVEAVLLGRGLTLAPVLYAGLSPLENDDEDEDPFESLMLDNVRLEFNITDGTFEGVWAGNWSILTADCGPDTWHLRFGDQDIETRDYSLESCLVELAARLGSITTFMQWQQHRWLAVRAGQLAAGTKSAIK